MSSQSHERFLALDAFRGIAALGVVLGHYTYIYDVYYQHTFDYISFKPGLRGVDLFFILSGFVIFFTLERAGSAKKFLKKRFIRLYPTYWICLIITFAIVSVFGLPAQEVTLWEATIGLTMVPQLLYIPPVDRSYWTLIPELSFYLGMAAITWAKGLKLMNRIGWIWLLFSFIHLHVYHLPVIGVVFNLKYILFFIAGIAFYHIKTKKNSWQSWLQVLVCLALAISMRSALEVQIVTACIFVLFAIFATTELPFLEHPVLLFLGRVSYAWYLLHQNIGYVIINLLKPYVHSMLIVVPPILITLLIATIVTDYIEKPVISMLKKALLTKSR